MKRKFILTTTALLIAIVAIKTVSANKSVGCVGPVYRPDGTFMGCYYQCPNFCGVTATGYYYVYNGQRYQLPAGTTVWYDL